MKQLTNYQKKAQIQEGLKNEMRILAKLKDL